MRTAAYIVLTALLLAAPATAATTPPKLSSVDASQYPTLAFSVVTSEPVVSAPRVRENGRPVVGLQAENLARAKSIVLAIDRSRSMEGAAFANAVAAARSFVRNKAPADRISIVAFGKSAIRLTGSSSSTIDADQALGSLTVDDKQGTALYDAVALGSRSLGAESLPGRVLIVLTDGDDVTSHATLGSAAAKARRAGVAVYAIGIEGKDFSPVALQELARVSGGAYFPAASASALEDAYASIAERLRRTWRVSYLTSARSGESIRLSAAIPGAAPGVVETKLPGDADDAVIPAQEPAKLLPGFLYQNNLGTVFLALLTGSCVILAFGLVIATPGGSRLRRRLEPHVAQTKRRREKGAPRERFAAASGAMNATEKALGHLKFWRRLHRLIERADLPLRTVELFYICVGCGFFFGFFAAAMAAPSLGILLAMGFGGFIPVVYAWFKARRRLNAIEDQLPDMLITIAASLKAGHSFRQGLQAVVEEGQPPAADEFKRVLTETSLGRPMDDALDEMAERVGSKNLSFVITAVTIQRQVGGSLAGIFDMVADAVRQRQQFARKIKGLTAMGRMSAYTLSGLPFFLAFMFSVINPDYMHPLWHTSTGHKLVISGLVMMSLGMAILKKIVNFKG
jgi:tight adherence protein B